MIFCFSCTTQTEAQKNSRQPTNVNTNPVEVINEPAELPIEIDTSKWKTYTDPKNRYSFRYPSNLILQKKKNGVRLYHYINFKHQDPCDGRDGPPFKKNLIDFDILFKVVKKSYSSYKWRQYDKDTDIRLGGLESGKMISKGYDGCGIDEFIYPLDKTRTFVAEQKVIGLFSAVNSSLPESKEALAHPDLLKNELEMMRLILESFQQLNNNR